MIKVYKTSVLTGNKNFMFLNVDEWQLFAYKNGGLVQEVFPDLTDVEREFIVTGMSPEEQAEYYNSFEEC